MIELRELRKEFAGVTALDGISLSVPAGGIHGIVGRSGAGKSTLIRCLTGLEPVTGGSALIDGLDITQLRGSALRESRRAIGMVFQHANLLDSRTALANVEHPLQVADVPRAHRRARALELLDIVGLSDRAGNHPAQLSGGQQQRVGVARALAADPPVLLMDEPFGAVDPITRASLQDELLRLQAELHKTIVFVTHDFSEAVRLGDRIAVLGPGSSVLQFDTPEAILTSPADETVSGFIGDDAALKTLTLRRVGDVDLGTTTTARASESPADFASRLRGTSDEWAVVLDEAGRPLRWVRGDRVAQMPDLGSGGQLVSGTVTVDSTLQEALDGLLSTASATTVVVDHDGAYRGTLGIDDLVDELRRIHHRHTDDPASPAGNGPVDPS